MNYLAEILKVMGEDVKSFTRFRFGYFCVCISWAIAYAISIYCLAIGFASIGAYVLELFGFYETIIPVWYIPLFPFGLLLLWINSAIIRKFKL